MKKFKETLEIALGISIVLGLVYFLGWFLIGYHTGIQEFKSKCLKNAKCQENFHPEVIWTDSGRYCNCLPDIGE